MKDYRKLSIWEEADVFFSISSYSYTTWIKIEITTRYMSTIVDMYLVVDMLKFAPIN